MQFVLTLHGETEWNLKGILQGHMDMDLHEVGIANAHQKGAILKRDYGHIVGMVSSDLIRGIHTGEIINQYLLVPYGIHRGLRECGFGDLEGKTKGEISLAFEWSYPHLSYDYRYLGGESYDEVVRRQREVLDGLAARYNATDIFLVVGHGASINSLLHFLGMPNLPMKRHEIRVMDYPCVGC